MNTLIEIINSFTPHQWFLFGGLVASIPGTYAIVEFVKARHYRKKAEELWSGFVVLNVLVWGSVLTFVDALITNFSQLSHIGSLIPAVTPWVSVWGPRVSATLLVIHIVATTLSKWWSDRKARKPISNINMPDLAAIAATEASPTVSGNPSSSMGTASAGVDVVPPPANLFN